MQVSSGKQLIGVLAQPVTASHVSTVQASPSSQSASDEQATAQSMAQLVASSSPSQVPSPQQ
jgi:hypothetical protein